MDSLAAATKDFKTLDQVEAKLNELGIKFSRGPAALDGATMPAEMLKPLEARKPDDIFFIRSRNSASFFKVISVEEKPADRRSGEPVRQAGDRLRTGQEEGAGHVRRRARRRQVRRRLCADHDGRDAGGGRRSAGGRSPERRETGRRSRAGRRGSEARRGAEGSTEELTPRQGPSQGPVRAACRRRRRRLASTDPRKLLAR